MRKDGADDARVKSAKDEDPGNPGIDFRGEKRSNDTHQSTTDPESVLYRKASVEGWIGRKRGDIL